ncbi:MAG: 30S ribosomal protein S3 [Patescibacteria group bacterium]
MGQKINPSSFRLGIVRTWPVRWFIKGNYAKFLEEDETIRKVIMSKIGQAGVSAVEIERTAGNTRVFIKAARPGFVIGRGGKGIEELSKAVELALRKLRGVKSAPLSLNVEELKRSEVSSVYVAQQIAWDLEKRLPFRRTMKKYLEAVMQSKETKGAKILLSGRLDGKEIARREWLAGRGGSLPLQTLRADIDYGRATAFTSYGTVGIKVWIYKGDIFDKKGKSNASDDINQK